MSHFTASNVPDYFWAWAVASWIVIGCRLLRNTNYYKSTELLNLTMWKCIKPVVFVKASRGATELVLKEKSIYM